MFTGHEKVHFEDAYDSYLYIVKFDIVLTGFTFA